MFRGSTQAQQKLPQCWGHFKIIWQTYCRTLSRWETTQCFLPKQIEVIQPQANISSAD
jgi:hypothetical protein